MTRPWVWSEQETDRLRAAFRRKSGGYMEPSTETLFAVAAAAVRIADERRERGALSEWPK